MSLATSSTGISWDLRDLFSGFDDPRLTAAIDQVYAEAEHFAAEYRGSIDVAGGPAAEHLLRGLERIEALWDALARPVVYANLLFSADTSKPEHRDLQQQMEQHNTSIANLLLFFELEWLHLSDDDAERLLHDPLLASYHHFLRSMRRYKPHTLSEAEERLMNERDLTGLHAWRRLFTELIASIDFPLEHEDESKHLSLDTILSLMRHSDRTLRQKAHRSLYQVLGGQSAILTYIYNTLIQDHQMKDRLRHYAHPMAQRNLSNQIEPEVVHTMLNVVETNYPLAQHYFALKARLLDLPQLELYDQYAPIGRQRHQIAYAQAQEMILEAFRGFDPRFADIAEAFFQQGWIDAEVRPGKRGGAFCNGYPPSNHPYILCNYTDDLRDVMTVAHELGHGIHFELARQQTLFNFYPTLPLAETASVFAEMVVFEYLLEQDRDPQTQLALICSKIEDIFATIFRQTVLTRFEEGVFAQREQRRLTTEQISAVWLDVNRRYYGDGVNQSDGYELGWSYIPHFINTPFYCYSYVFGELLVLALYGMYRDQGASFLPRYRGLLEAGASRAPADLLAELGVDLCEAGFWQLGFNELRRLVARMEELAADQQQV